MSEKKFEDKNSEKHQQMEWNVLTKKISSLVRNLNITNVREIGGELLRENIVRSRGLFCKKLMERQSRMPGCARVYAALVAIVNEKYPVVGKLLIERLLVQFKRSYDRKHKSLLLSSAAFLAQLLNQRVLHGCTILEILTLLLNVRRNIFFEVAISLIRQCGRTLHKTMPKDLRTVLKVLRKASKKHKFNKRVKYMVDVTCSKRKESFKLPNSAIPDALDNIGKETIQIPHLILISDSPSSQRDLNEFRVEENQ